MKRKVAAIIGIAVLSASLAACGGGDGNGGTEDKGGEPVKVEEEKKDGKEEKSKKDEVTAADGFISIADSGLAFTDAPVISMDKLEMSVSREGETSNITVKNNSDKAIDYIVVEYVNDKGGSGMVPFFEAIPAGGEASYEISESSAASIEELKILSVTTITDGDNIVAYYNNMDKYITVVNEEEAEENKVLEEGEEGEEEVVEEVSNLDEFKEYIFEDSEKIEEKEVQSFDEVKDKFPQIVDEGTDDIFKYSRAMTNTLDNPIVDVIYLLDEGSFESDIAIMPGEKIFKKSVSEPGIPEEKVAAYFEVQEDGSIIRRYYADVEGRKEFGEALNKNPVEKEAAKIASELAGNIEKLKAEIAPGEYSIPYITIDNGLGRDIFDLTLYYRDTLKDNQLGTNFSSQAILAGEKSTKEPAFGINDTSSYEPRKLEFFVPDDDGTIYFVEYDLKVAEFFKK